MFIFQKLSIQIGKSATGKIVQKVTDQQTHVTSGQAEPAMTDILKPYFYTDNHNQKHLVAVVKVGAYVSNINSNIAKINANLTGALLVASLVAMLLAFLIAVT